MKRVIVFTLLFLGCGTPEVKIDEAVPLVSSKPIAAPLVFGNDGIALMKQDVVYLAPSEEPIGANAEVLAINDTTDGAAIWARRALDLKSVPEVYQQLVGQKIFASDGQQCKSTILGFAVESYVRVKGDPLSIDESDLPADSPSVLVAMLADDGACSAGVGVASLKPLPEETFYDELEMDEENKIFDALKSYPRDSILLDPIGPDDVIVSIEGYEKNPCKSEVYYLEMFRFTKKSGVWRQEFMFRVDDSDGVVFIAKTKETLILTTETGVYHRGRFDYFSPTRLEAMGPSSTCKP